jgi:alanine dehydrogenase
VTAPETLLLTRREVAALLSLDECIEAVEAALLAHAAGRTVPPSVLALQVPGGGLHVKAAGLVSDGRGYLAAKLNANFPANPERHDLPTIQGVIALVDAGDGRLLALMDSIEITALRTAAATAVAARRLARPDASVATIVGCGRQGRVQLQALARVRPLRRVLAFDSAPDRAAAFAREMSAALAIQVDVAPSAAAAAAAGDICVTCTTSRRPVLAAADVRPGTFVAAVGADSPDKQELDPALLARATVVVDHLGQCAAFGELHHALAAGVIGLEQVHAQLHELVAGARPGRTTEDEITVFDSTGTALQDVAAAALVFEKSIRLGHAAKVALGA